MNTSLVRNAVWKAAQWNHFQSKNIFLLIFLLQISTDNMAIVYVENSLILSHSIKIKEKKWRGKESCLKISWRNSF